MLVFLIIALFATITLRGFFRLIRERDPFIRLAGTGLVSLLALQAFINLGVAVRLLPAKGMTLPFVSYRRLVPDRDGDRGGDDPGLHPVTSAGRDRRHPAVAASLGP